MVINQADEAYRELVTKILSEGVTKQDRTGVGTLSVFGPQLRFDLRDGFPILTLKRTHFKSVLHEFIWMVCRGETNTAYLKQNGVTIWDEWADEDGNLGPIYGQQFRAWVRPETVCPYCADGLITGSDGNGSDVTEKCAVCRGTGHEIIDQVQVLIDGLRKNPYSRRHIISLWNVADLPNMALPPCHAFMQFNVVGDKLSCHLYQRSADVALGVPFNIAFYALFTHVVAQQTHLTAQDLIITFGDAHIYLNHVDGMKELLTRTSFTAPRLCINRGHDSVNWYEAADFDLLDYRYQPAIKLPIAV